jgi:hypothetical protein
LKAEVKKAEQELQAAQAWLRTEIVILDPKELQRPRDAERVYREVFHKYKVRHYELAYRQWRAVNYNDWQDRIKQVCERRREALRNKIAELQEQVDKYTEPGTVPDTLQKELKNKQKELCQFSRGNHASNYLPTAVPQDTSCCQQQNKTDDRTIRRKKVVHLYFLVIDQLGLPSKLVAFMFFLSKSPHYANARKILLNNHSNNYPGDGQSKIAGSKKTNNPVGKALAESGLT